MDVKKLIDIMSIAERLKCTTRHSWTSTNRQESVADHSWRLGLLGYFMKDEFPEADFTKIMLMCLVHDLGEAFTGDIPVFDKTSDDEENEKNEIFEFLNNLPSPYNKELKELFEEMLDLNTLEAKIYKSLDMIEVLIQHNEADISTWIPLEYELNQTYGNDSAQFSEYMKNLRSEILKDCVAKIDQVK